MASVPAPLLLISFVLLARCMRARAAWFTGRVSWLGAPGAAPSPLLASSFWLRLATKLRQLWLRHQHADNGDRCGSGGDGGGAAVPLGPKTFFDQCCDVARVD